MQFCCNKFKFVCVLIVNSINLNLNVMLISNFSLYKTEWLDVVFDKRNKEYGAYYIRQHYAENLTKALLIAVVTIVGSVLAVGAAIKVEPVITPPVKIVDVTTINLPVEPEKPVEAKPETAPPAKQSPPVRTTQYIEPVPVPDQLATVEPPTQVQLANTAVGPETIDVPGDGTMNTPVNSASGGGGDGRGTDPTESNEVVTTAGLTVMPNPVGGTEAWTKFLKKNLRYPALAVEEGKSGKVWISFIIEKDGTLTDIKVVRGPGFGMDEEALRVLKKAPAWTPGIQHNKPVRVQYTLPINFALE